MIIRLHTKEVVFIVIPIERRRNSLDLNLRDSKLVYLNSLNIIVSTVSLVRLEDNPNYFFQFYYYSIHLSYLKHLLFF